jgi:hypothetical protein
MSCMMLVSQLVAEMQRHRERMMVHPESCRFQPDVGKFTAAVFVFLDFM